MENEARPTREDDRRLEPVVRAVFEENSGIWAVWDTICFSRIIFGEVQFQIAVDGVSCEATQQIPPTATRDQIRALVQERITKFKSEWKRLSERDVPHEKCLSCGTVLFEKTVLDEQRNMAIDSHSALKLQFDGVDYYFVCRSCGAKNVAIVSGDKTMKISHVKH